MADIFDEINEDLKRDQMQELWSRYGKYVIIAVSLVIIGVGARQGYTAWQDRQATQAATIYHQALKADDSASALTAQLDTLSPGYATKSRGYDPASGDRGHHGPVYHGETGCRDASS